MCGMTHWHVWHDSFTCVVWLIDMSGMTHLHVTHLLVVRDSFIPYLHMRLDYMWLVDMYLFIKYGRLVYIFIKHSNYSYNMADIFYEYIWQFPLKMQHLRNLPNRQTEICRYLVVQIQIDILLHYKIVARISSFWIGRILGGVQQVQWKLSYILHVTRLHLWNDSLTCDSLRVKSHSHGTQLACAKFIWLLHDISAHATRLHVWHDSYTYVAWLIDMRLIYRYDAAIPSNVYTNYITVMHRCDPTDLHVRHDSHACVTYRIIMHDVTRFYVKI